MIIAISGAAASGKGTLARLLAVELNLPHYDFGLMFRAIAYCEFSLESELDKFLAVRYGKIFFSGGDITDILRYEEVGLLAAKRSGEDSAQMARLATSLVKHTDFVCDGRTCGTEIYPNADYRFYLQADLATRSQRRQNDGGNSKVFAEREELDRLRLRMADGSIVIDTTGRNKEDCLKQMLSYIK